MVTEKDTSLNGEQAFLQYNLIP